MIQRVQSVYWFLTVVILVAFLFLPLFSYGPTGGENYFMVQDCTALVVSIIVIAVLTAINIFLFKNRPLQIRISWLISLLILIAFFLFVGVHYYFLLQGEAPAEAGDQVEIQWAVALPVVALILNVLAQRAVKADDKLVSASDRLR